MNAGLGIAGMLEMELSYRHTRTETLNTNSNL